MTDVAVSPLRDALTSNVRRALLVLLGRGTAAYLLLVACANVVNLLLAQAAARKRNWRFVRRCGARAAAGAPVPYRSPAAFRRRRRARRPRGALGGGRVGGDGPEQPAAPPGCRDKPTSSLLYVRSFGGGRGRTGRTSRRYAQLLEMSRGRWSSAVRDIRARCAASALSRIIIAAQMAITVVLLAGAGLLGRSLLRVLAVDPGFRTEHILTIDLAMPFPEKTAEVVNRVTFLNELFSRLRAVPGVREVGGVNGLPLTTGLADGTYLLTTPQENCQPAWRISGDCSTIRRVPAMPTIAWRVRATFVP